MSRRLSTHKRQVPNLPLAMFVHAAVLYS